jgi:C4-dicarboxylate-specific signal transduction histidine kinase
VLLTTLLAYFYTRRTMESLAKDQISQSLGYLDREVTLRAREMSMQIHLMAQEEVLRLALEDSYLGRSARASAQRKIESYVRTGAFERIYLMNTEGRLVLASDPALVKTLNVADRDYFRKALAGQLVLDTVPVSRVTGRPFLAVATPCAPRTAPWPGWWWASRTRNSSPGRC